jgi:hypothetical protein
MQQEVDPYTLELEIDTLRDKLYEIIDNGVTDDVIRISQELDKLILIYTKYCQKSI